LPLAAGADVEGTLETEGGFPLEALVAATLCPEGDALAGAPLNGFMVNSSADTTARPTRRSTE